MAFERDVALGVLWFQWALRISDSSFALQDFSNFLYKLRCGTRKTVGMLRVGVATRSNCNYCRLTVECQENWCTRVAEVGQTLVLNNRFERGFANLAIPGDRRQVASILTITYLKCGF